MEGRGTASTHGAAQGDRSQEGVLPRVEMVARDGEALAAVASADWLPPVGPFSCFGQRWAIQTTDAELADFLADAYASMPDRGQGPVAMYRALPAANGHDGAVLRDDELIGVCREPARVMGRLIWAVNRQVIERSLDRIVLHAAAAELGDATVVLPATMESGKTTLVTGLMDRGFSYLTDEAAAIADDLTVEGYAKPLSIDPGSWQILHHHKPRVSKHLSRYLDHQWQVPPHRVASVVRRGRLSLMVFPRYEQGAATRIERVSPATAVRLVVACTFAPEGQRVPASRLRRLAAIMSAVPAYKMVSGDLADACEGVMTALRQTVPNLAPR